MQNKHKNKYTKRLRLKKKIRVKISGTSQRPRLSIFRSNKFIYAQLINDETGKTIGAASDAKMTKGTKTERAKEVGRLIGEVCKAAKMDQVVFDRNGFKYTGRIKLLADVARDSGLKF